MSGSPQSTSGSTPSTCPCPRVAAVDSERKGRHPLDGHVAAEFVAKVGIEARHAVRAFESEVVDAPQGSFDDHDDTNIIYYPGGKQWVDLQIMYELYSAIGLDASKIKKYCDNVSNDTRRVVTVRTCTD